MLLLDKTGQKKKGGEPLTKKYLPPRQPIDHFNGLQTLPPSGGRRRGRGKSNRTPSLIGKVNHFRAAEKRTVRDPRKRRRVSTAGRESPDSSSRAWKIILVIVLTEGRNGPNLNQVWNGKVRRGRIFLSVGEGP